MNKQIIKQKIEDLEKIMVKYREELAPLEKGLFETISEYRKALDEERIKEIKAELLSK